MKFLNIAINEIKINFRDKKKYDNVYNLAYYAYYSARIFFK